MNKTALIATSDGLKYGVSVNYTPSEPGSANDPPWPEDIEILTIRPPAMITDEIRRLVYNEIDEQLRKERDELVSHKLDARDDYRRSA